jgi:hypothetical protein
MLWERRSLLSTHNSFQEPRDLISYRTSLCPLAWHACFRLRGWTLQRKGIH